MSGNGSSDETALRPRIVQGLAGHNVVDVAIGENHILALTVDSKVFAWGNNQNGQCGVSFFRKFPIIEDIANLRLS